MGSTPNRAYVYPDSTSDTQIWTHFETLADDIDADVETVSDRVANLEIRPHTLLSLGTPSIANNSIQLVNGTVLWDPTGQWGAGNPSRITVNASGLWEIGAVMRFASQATASGQRNVRLYKNGVEEIQFGNPAVTNYNATNIICAGATQLVLASGDYIEAYAYQNSGGALSLTGNSRLWAKFLQL